MNLCKICGTHSEQFHILRPAPGLRQLRNSPEAEPLPSDYQEARLTHLLKIPEFELIGVISREVSYGLFC